MEERERGKEHEGMVPPAWRRALRSSTLPLLLGLALSGCFPSSQRQLPKTLFPADSLSRQIAEATAVDTLREVWRAEAPPEAGLRYGLTLAWLGDRIVVADAQQGALHTFTDRGEYVGQQALEALPYPFLSGALGDTMAVLSRGAERVALLEMAGDGSGRVLHTRPIPPGRNAVAVLTRRGLFVKTADEDAGAALYRLDADGAVAAEHPLPDPYWRHIGLLRTEGDTLLSLSGYRPAAWAMPLAAEAGVRPDSLPLVGLDSPQMGRSRLFALGEVDEPPLLSPSATAAGGLLFALNARPGWVRIDAFARTADGFRLRRGLVSPNPGPSKNFFASDLAARAIGGGIDFVVLEVQPRPALVRYRWTTGVPISSVTSISAPSPAPSSD